jgi:hypothetical protein
VKISAAEKHKKKRTPKEISSPRKEEPQFSHDVLKHKALSL